MKSTRMLQRKCAYGQHTVPHEREADRVAARVTSTETIRPPAPVMRAPGADCCNDAGSVPVANGLGGAGQSLSPNAREFFEPRFGHDFSRVRVHADDRAAESAAVLGADAYTIGDHVVFGAQRYAPSTPQGRRLLAHELTHVVQQRDSGTPIVQRHTSFTAKQQTDGDALGWKHPAGATGLLVSDNGNMVVEDKGWKNSKRLWALDSLIQVSNAILSAQGSRVRLKAGGVTISGKAPDVSAGANRTLKEIEVESASGGALKLTGDCGQACKEVMGAPTDPEESVAVVRPKGVERYTTERPYESRDTSASGLGTTEEFSEEIFKMEFGAGLTREQALKKYNDLPAADKENFDRKYGINKFAEPKVGQGVTISTEYDMPGFAGNPGKKTWNFHFAATILRSGSDYVSLENIAKRADTAWFFWMYGPEKKHQSFHEFQGGMREHGNKFTTMVVQPEKLLNGVVNADGVHLVSDPDTWQTSQIGKLAKGTQVDVLAKGSNWRKVIVLSGTQIGKTGWISNMFFEQK